MMAKPGGAHIGRTEMTDHTKFRSKQRSQTKCKKGECVATDRQTGATGFYNKTQTTNWIDREQIDREGPQQMVCERIDGQLRWSIEELIDRWMHGWMSG